MATFIEKLLQKFQVTKPIEKEDINMKKKVQFTVTDGVKPGRYGAAKTFGLAAPLEVRLRPNETQTINLGVACDHPLLVWPTRALAAEKVELLNVCVVPASMPITLTLKNSGSTDYVADRGTTLVYAHVLTDVEVEEK